MQLYPEEYILSGPYKVYKYEPDAITEVRILFCSLVQKPLVYIPCLTYNMCVLFCD